MLPDTSGCQSLPCFSLRALDTPEAKLGAKCMSCKSSAGTVWAEAMVSKGDSVARRRHVQMMPR